MNCRLTFTTLLTILCSVSARVGSPNRELTDTGCKEAWEQCGGDGYNGPTCCAEGYNCLVDSEWWSSCKPAPVDAGTVGPWGTCGGNEYTGPTTCTSGYKCNRQDDWYSQCIPCGGSCSDLGTTTDAPTSGAPTDAPTGTPTEAPTTGTPTPAPTDAPTDAPTSTPTEAPTSTPTDAPTDAPTSTPTEAPTSTPTDAPTDAPTEASTGTPTPSPTRSFGEMKTCIVTGDPHFQTFAGVWHSFMGQPSVRSSFYYVAPCDGPSVKDPPFRILGEHATTNNQGAGLDYLTLELEDSDGTIYHVFMSSALHSFGSDVDSDYDSTNPIILTELSSGVNTPIGSRFQVMYTQLTPWGVSFELWVDDHNKAVEIHMNGQNYYVSGRFRQHTALIRVDTAYENEMCGLCGPLDVSKAGSLENYISSMPVCGGGAMDFPTSPDAIQTAGESDTLFDMYGWTFERGFYLNNCGTYYDNSDNTGNAPAQKSCNSDIAAQVTTECESAYDAVKDTLCSGALVDYCQELVSYCSIDACVEANGDVDAIEDAVMTAYIRVVSYMNGFDFLSK